MEMKNCTIESAHIVPSSDFTENEGGSFVISHEIALNKSYVMHTLSHCDLENVLKIHNDENQLFN